MRDRPAQPTTSDDFDNCPDEDWGETPPAQPTTQPTDAPEHRLNNAQARAAEAASEWCWNATPESEEALRNAVAEWRTALGLWRLAGPRPPGGPR